MSRGEKSVALVKGRGKIQKPKAVVSDGMKK
jgi:hypothetical protein